jgi:hypothetical protein
MFKRFIPFLAVSFLLGSLAPTISKAAMPVQSVEQIELTPQEKAIDNKIFEQSEVLLGAIENIPDNIVEQGPQATAEWFQNQTGYIVTVDSEQNLRFSEASSTEVIDNQTDIDTPAKLLKPTDPQYNLTGCIAAVGIALVSNGLPFSKILKVKSAIKVLGGTTKAVTVIKDLYDSYRWNGFSRSDAIRKALNGAAGGLASDLKSALLDFFNISNVIANCF